MYNKILVLLFCLLWPAAPVSAYALSLKPGKKLADICLSGYCEPQVRPACKASNLKVQPCGSMALSFVQWLNAYGPAALRAGYAAAGYKGRITSATIYCNVGIHVKKKSNGYWSQHAFGRACDGNRIRVNNTTFRYNGRGLKKPKSKDNKFFIAFLDYWGPTGPGFDPKTSTLTIDYNLGVRDCREDNLHCRHYHISVPCYQCALSGVMKYE